MPQFKTMAAFSKFVDRKAEETKTLTARAAERGSLILYANIIKTYGSPLLASLKQSTQADRLALGYSANEPLLRDGTLLRDKEEAAHLGSVAAVGNPEIVSFYHEFGYNNSRTGTWVVERPVHLLGLQMSEAQTDVMVLGLLAKLLDS